MADIAKATQEQSQDIDQVVPEMSQATQENAASAEELAAVMSMFRTAAQSGSPESQVRLPKALIAS